MKIEFSKGKKSQAGLCGHIGVGHVNSHSGFVQEDGAGFAVLTTIVNRAAKLDLRISRIKVENRSGLIEIELESKGKGKAIARNGITPSELSLMKNAVGKSAVCPQTLATGIFGRIIGQGVLEVPNAFITSASLAVANSFLRNFPDLFVHALEDTPLSAGCTIGTILQINGLPVSTMITINAGEGGIGPNEDTEGNMPIGNKRKVMEKIGLDHLATIIVESKAYVPAWKDKIHKTTLVVRGNEKYDNTVVRECLIKAAKSYGYPVFQPDNPYPRKAGSLLEVQKDISNKIIMLGVRLSEAKTAGEKNHIAAQLAMIIKNDLGSVTFMSNELNDIFDNGGLLPGTASVISSAVTSDYANRYKIPLLTKKDITMYVDTILEALKILKYRLNDANKEMQQKSILRGTIKEIERNFLKQ